MMNALWTKPTPDLGAKFETLIYLHLLRLAQKVFYLRVDNCEVDFCVVKDDKPYELVQACYDLSDQKTRQREIKALFELGKRFRIKRLRIVTRDEQDQIKSGAATIELTPVAKYLIAAEL